MKLGDWVAAAWSSVLDDAPLLANPSEYRTMMYEAFWEGKQPKSRPQSGQRGKRGSTGPPSPPAPSRGPSKAALRELQAEAQRIQAMQAANKPG